MKPNEDDDLVCQNMIVQLGMLILKERVIQHAQINKNMLRSAKEVSSHHQEEEFLFLWKSCERIDIEVWLHCNEQFNEQEAMEGHCAYLLMEQWQIQIEQNRSSEAGFRCTDKMLIQAMKSKLYFSQLSAWLSLTKGEFPRHIYFRLCENDRKAPLQRFSRPPEFHRFPRVTIAPNKELVVSLHSLPRFDISKEYPMFSCVLADAPAETPTKIPRNKDVSLDHEISTPMQNDGKGFGKEKITGYSTAKAVRKLAYCPPRMCTGPGSRTKSASTEGEFKNSVYEETSTTVSGNDETASLETSSNSYEQQDVNLRDCCEKANHCELLATDVIGSTNLKESFRNDIQTCCRHIPHEIIGEGEYQNSKKAVDCRLLNSDNRKEEKCTGSETFEKSNTNSSSFLTNEHFEVSECRKVMPMTCKCITLENQKTFESFRCYCQHARTSPDLLSYDRTPDADNTKNIWKYSKANSCTSCKTSSLGKADCFHKKQQGIREDCSLGSRNDFRGETQFSDIDSSLSEEIYRRKYIRDHAVQASEFKGDVNRISPFVKESEVLPGIEKDLEHVLPGMKSVFEEEYKRKINEKLLKCFSLNKQFCGDVQNTTYNRQKTGETWQLKKDVLHDQRSGLRYQAQSAARHHFRHASTGTLPVFHPSTRLPMSSSPAPFRKTRELSTVDDINSSTCSSFNLQNLSNALSKSAPTLTTQSLLGNFEESVLNDRLLPDGVVEGFTAELSASSSRKCLAHVTLPVQAYFFRLSDDNAPSPYMGYISLDVPELPRRGYHVPKKGTIQLTLFNPNQTVVKVFVVLYDFSDMQPNFQTFLRQKSTSLVESDSLVNRSHGNLHYLIHLRFASSKSGRIYLHTDIRLIFARHRPDQAYLKTTTSGPTNPKYVPRHDIT